MNIASYMPSTERACTMAITAVGETVVLAWALGSTIADTNFGGNGGSLGRSLVTKSRFISQALSVYQASETVCSYLPQEKIETTDIKTQSIARNVFDLIQNGVMLYAGYTAFNTPYEAAYMKGYFKIVNIITVAQSSASLIKSVYHLAIKPAAKALYEQLPGSSSSQINDQQKIIHQQQQMITELLKQQQRKDD